MHHLCRLLAAGRIFAVSLRAVLARMTAAYSPGRAGPVPRAPANVSLLSGLTYHTHCVYSRPEGELTNTAVLTVRQAL